MTAISTVLARIVDTTQQLKKQHITENEKNEVKNVILDRIGCGLAAKRLGLGATVNNYGEQNNCGGESTIWGTMSKTQPHMAALVNGAISSHLEYDAHDSMVPSVLALGEQKGADGLSVISSMKIGSYTGLLLWRLIASGIEKRGMHWPAYISPFIAASACSSILGLSKVETANSIGIAASLSPAAPFESFTRGGSVRISTEEGVT